MTKNQLWDTIRDEANAALADNVSMNDFAARFPDHRRLAIRAYKHAIGYREACRDTMRFPASLQD